MPDLSAEQSYLPISSVVLGNNRSAIAGHAGTKTENGKGRHPLVYDGQKVIPSITRVFRKNQQMYVSFEAYRPPHTTTLPLVVRVGFYRGQSRAFESEPLYVTEALDPRSTITPVNLSLPLAALSPGKYTCQVSVLSPVIRKFAFWRAPILLLP